MSFLTIRLGIFKYITSLQHKSYSYSLNLFLYKIFQTYNVIASSTEATSKDNTTVNSRNKNEASRAENRTSRTEATKGKDIKK